MSSAETNSDSTAPAAADFATTHWSVVTAAGAASSPRSREALEALCRAYWYPLYAFVRRQGHSPHDAQDLTQAFFVRFLEKNYLGDVRRERGKFRSFLLGALKHFLANEWDRARTVKRGGRHSFVAFDDSAEARYGLEPRDDMTAERLYERRWALTLLETVIGRLREEQVVGGKAKQFDGLKTCLTGEQRSIPYAALGETLGLSEGAVKVIVHRLRRRYRELLRAEIANIVTRPEDVDDELRCLFAALGGR